MLPGITTALADNWRPGAQQVIFLGASGAWTVPAKWTSDNNKLVCFGAGGGGGSGNFNFNSGTGGAGGSCCVVQNVILSPGAVLFYNVPSGSPGGVGSGHDGSAGGPAWIRTDGLNTPPTTAGNGCLAAGGAGGSWAHNTNLGSTAGCIGNYATAGGGSIITGDQGQGFGGGGCASDGANGLDTGGIVGGAGGGPGGGGGGGQDNGGSNGATYHITAGGFVGPGGGGGGGSPGGNGVAGGYMGAGGGGAGFQSGMAGGNGGAGGIIILYGP